MNTQELIAAIAKALPYAADGEWRCDPETGNIFTTERLNVGYVHMMPDLALCVLAKQMASELTASQERERVLREALEECAADLESEINARADNDLPRRIARDLEVVSRARQALQSTEQQG